MKNEFVELFLEEYEEELDEFIKKNLFYSIYFKDFKQEVLLKICEIDEYKLRELFVTDGMMNYTKRIILNMFNSKYQPYHKKLRFIDPKSISNNVYIEEHFIEREDELYEEDEMQVFISDLYNKNTNDFFLELFKYYIKNDLTLEKISKDLKLDRTKIFNIFVDIKNKLKQEWNQKKQIL